MTKDEKSALLQYLEFNLVTMVEQYQISLSGKIGQSVTDEILGDLYDGAYEVLNEMERTLTDQPEDKPKAVFFYKPSR
jgi:hypothetical protein